MSHTCTSPPGVDEKDAAKLPIRLRATPELLPNDGGGLRKVPWTTSQILTWSSSDASHALDPVDHARRLPSSVNESPSRGRFSSGGWTWSASNSCLATLQSRMVRPEPEPLAAAA